MVEVNVNNQKVEFKYCLIDVDGWMEEGLDVFVDDKFVGSVVGMYEEEVELQSEDELEELINNLTDN